MPTPIRLTPLPLTSKLPNEPVEVDEPLMLCVAVTDLASISPRPPNLILSEPSTVKLNSEFVWLYP